MSVDIVRDINDLRAKVLAAQHQARSIVLVPTMGALHQGHLSLLKHARAFGDLVALSIFVNPLQFNSANDLAHYPRTEERDLNLAQSAGADLVFLPELDQIYPEKGASTRATLKAGSMAQGLCGATRAGHFDGVVTVVSILFNLFQPQAAVFGEKDFQQCKVIEQMVRDLHFPVQLHFAPLLRDHDGLALSSRNTRLPAEERSNAILIPKALFEARRLVQNGESKVSTLKDFVRRALDKLRIDYVEIVDPEDLSPLTQIHSAAQLLVAAYVGEVRLIDNIRLEARVPTPR